MIISKALIWPQAYLHELNQIDKIKEMAQVNPIKPIINLYSPGICFPLRYKKCESIMIIKVAGQGLPLTRIIQAT